MGIIKTKDRFISSTREMFDKHPVIKFLSIILLLVAYFIFVSLSNGIKDGFLISILTWSFFVLCTPIADAGILVDFPMRLIAGIKMLYSEIAVWVIAISLNLCIFFNNPDIYNKTILLSLFKHILDAPFPYWIIIILSAIGTYSSIYIADYIVDSKNQKKVSKNILIKHKIIIFLFLFIMIIILYDFLLNKLGVNIPLI